jgi:hydrogenase small subunit
MAVATGRAGDLALDEYHRPATLFTTFTHSGCTRNSFFEYKQSTLEFGQGTRTGCLFYELGCRGPMTHSSCNRILWNRQSSKTRAGHPCLGCTEPDFPADDLMPGTVFKTVKVSGVIPKDLPTGADSLTYMAAAAAARISAPQWSREDMFVV